MAKYGKLNLGQIEALVNKLGGMDAVERILSETAKVVVEKITEVLLALVATVSVPAHPTKFVVKDELSVGDHNGLKIAPWSNNFKNWFGGKTEEPTTGSDLVVSRLTKPAYDSKIIQTIGGEEKAETTLSEFHILLKKQGNGQDGVLTKEYWNVAYIRDINGILRTVLANWYRDGWRLYANAVDNPDRWRDGYRLVSRK